MPRQKVSLQLPAQELAGIVRSFVGTEVGAATATIGAVLVSGRMVGPRILKMIQDTAYAIQSGIQNAMLDPIPTIPDIPQRLGLTDPEFTPWTPEERERQREIYESGDDDTPFYRDKNYRW